MTDTPPTGTFPPGRRAWMEAWRRAPLALRAMLGAAVVTLLVLALHFGLLRPRAAGGAEAPADEPEAAAETPGSPAMDPGLPPIRVRGLHDSEIPVLVRLHLERASEALREGEIRAAASELRDAVALSPEDPLLRNRLRELEELEERMARVRSAFAGQDYATALWILYRLPEGFAPLRMSGYKARGWYNLGLVDLRAGRCDQAEARFLEALDERPGDRETREALEFARWCQGASRGSLYRAMVAGMPFRALEE